MTRKTLLNQPATTVDTASFVKQRSAPTFASPPLFVPRPPFKTTSDAPTITSTDSTVGGAGTTYYGQPQISPSDLTSLTYHGCVLGARTFNGNLTMQNVANGYYAPGNYYPTGIPSPYDVEFDFYGSALRMAVVNTTAGLYSYQMYVDGEAISATLSTVPSPSSVSATYMTYTWAASRKRRIRFSLPANFALLSFASGTPAYAFSAVQKPPFSVHIIGDSWAEGTGTTSTLNTFPMIIKQLTGWEVYQGGQGGTGYGAPGPDAVVALSTFGSPNRLRAVADSKPNLIVFAGTSNNDTAGAPLQGYVAASFAAAAAASPTSKIVVVGPQNTTGTATTARLAARDAIMAAAQAAGLPFIDPIALGWITGTGTVGTPSGATGNASLFVGGVSGNDAAHLVQDGYYYWAARIVAELMKLNLAG